MKKTDNTANILGPTNVNVLKGDSIPGYALATFQTHQSLDTFLLTKGYTQNSLDSMTKNDKIYAARKRIKDITPPAP